MKVINAEGIILQLMSDAVITVERNNPLFNDPDKFFQDISYAVKAPPTESNKLFFKMGHLVEATNDYYLLTGCRFDVNGIQMLAGNIRYRVGADDVFEANLEPNYAAVNSLLNGIRLPEIITEDADYSMYSDPDAFEAMMLDTAMNPDKYPFIFFPVQNPNFAPHTIKMAPPGHPTDEPVDTAVTNAGFVNFFDVQNNRFVARQASSTVLFGVSPFFKVSYILDQIARYLGFTTDGGLSFNEDLKNLCIYTRIALGQTVILPSMQYMPNILISDFLKFVRDRLHLALDFDLRTGTLTVKSFKSIITSAEEVDITPFIETSIEQEVPDAQSLSVTLKTDQADKNFLVIDEAGNEIYPPTSTLVAGTGEKKVEWDCGTTKGFDGTDISGPGQKYPVVDQTCLHEAWQRVDPGVTTLPPDMAYTDISDPTTLNNWPFRIFKYLGFQEIVGGSFPNAEPYDLNDDDMGYCRFINDSKRLLLYAAVPPIVLSQWKLTTKYVNRTKGLNYSRYIIEKILYDAGADKELIDTKLYVRTINYRADSNEAIIPFQPIVSPDDLQNLTARVKAYFDPAIHGITSLQLTVVDELGGIIPSNAITIPTNTQGAGGVAISITGSDHPPRPAKIRVYQGMPRYAIYGGEKIFFTKQDEYWEMSLSTRPPFAILVNTYVIFF